MDEFSFGGAWRAGWQLLAERVWLYAAILVGLGVIVPLALQLLLAGNVAGMTSPFSGQGATQGLSHMMGPGSAPAPSGGSPVLGGIVMLAGYAIQMVSYFACWRLALGRASLGGGLGFGALGGILMVVATIVALALMYGIGRALQAEPEAYALLIPLMLIPLMVLIALFYTFGAAMLATFLAVAIALTMLFGTLLGNAGLAATLFGRGSGMVAVLYIVMAFVLLWLASRFCCVGPLLADRRSLNLPAAMRDSWRLTFEDRWPILRYLFVVGAAGALAFVVALGGTGVLATKLVHGDAAVAQWLGFGMGALMTVPLVFFATMIPAGIYRDLTRSDLAAEVFA